MSDEAKAVEAVANAASNGIDLTRQIGSYFARVMQVPVDEATGMLADYFKFKRFELQVSLCEKTKAIINSKPGLVNMRAVPPKIALPIFYGASIEEDEELHTIWAKMLASAMDPQQPKPRAAYADILKQMEPQDVALLSHLFQLYQNKKSELDENGAEELYLYKRDSTGNFPLAVYRFYKDKILEGFSLPENEYSLIVSNIRRLGICYAFSYHSSRDDYILSFTELGFNFIQVCAYGNDKNDPYQ